jgi:hypothetical protein
VATRSHRRRPAQTVELFPFLAVLACVIGTLVLLVILVTSGLLGSTRSVSLVGTSGPGHNSALRPRYVEITGSGVILHPGKEVVPTGQIGRGNTALARLLREVAANRAEEYIIVALRPSGYPYFDDVRDQVEGKGIKIGYEPIDEDWELRIRR